MNPILNFMVVLHGCQDNVNRAVYMQACSQRINILAFLWNNVFVADINEVL